MRNIERISKNLKKELGKEINMDALSAAFTKRGFTLLYLESEDGAEQLQLHCLEEYAKNKKCFTYISSVKLVFVDGTLNVYDIIKLLLHELAHIELRHIGYADRHVYDEVSAEIEADAVVYNVLNTNGKKYIVALAVVIFILFLNALGITLSIQNKNNIPTNTIPVQTTEQNQNYTADKIEDTVYITRTGKKFHKKSCRYVQKDGARSISRNEAIKHYTPCSVCNP